MEVKQMFGLARKAQPFTSENYPDIAVLSDNGILNFSIVHVLKHHAKSIRELKGYAHGSLRAGNTRVQFGARLAKLFFNNVQLWRLIHERGSARQARWALMMLSKWESVRSAGIEDVPPFSTMAEVREGLYRFGDTLEELLGKLEPADHGAAIDLDYLSVGVLRFQEQLIRLAEPFGFTRAEFEQWLIIHARTMANRIESRS